MPKIIKDVREKILAEAKRQTLTAGYESVTVRSVVASCGISVGTFYNYFRSKEELIASFLLEDWILSLNSMRDAVRAVSSAEASLQAVFERIAAFAARYRHIFHDENAFKNASGQFRPRHRQLRTQIAEVLGPVCARYAKADSPFLRDYIAEALVTWSVEECAFSVLWQVLSCLF